MLPKQPLEFYSEKLAGVDRDELQGKLVVIEGPDSVGRSTQVARLRTWLEHKGHAVMDTGLARGALAGKGIQQAKEGNTLGPITMTPALLPATTSDTARLRLRGSHALTAVIIGTKKLPADRPMISP